MDLVDRFVRDGVFGKNSHRHHFKDGESKVARAAWLQEIDAMCKRAGIGYVVREAQDEQGNPGFEFGFADKGAHAAFVFNAFGDLVSPRGHIYSHHFTDANREYREAFFLAAEAHLSKLGIEHHWRVEDGELQFAFDRFSDRLMLEALIEQGTIDASAQGIMNVRAMQRRLGVSPVDLSTQFGFDLT